MEEPFKSSAPALYRELQETIVKALEQIEGGGATFGRDQWTREDIGGGHGGGGDTRVLAGEVFEKAGVNFSEVEGKLPAEMSKKLVGEEREASFLATGLSLVIHPRSPMIPTVHANFRYLEVEGRKWFGGGTDLTPYALFEEDAEHFHQTLKGVCDSFDKSYYPRFKTWCDEYFYLPHRAEARGVGGLFFDYLGKDDPEKLASYARFQEAAGRSFLECYLPIVERRQSENFDEEDKKFQLQRRGRYVEFNLIYDRGTLFGLKTGGRTESILMSLPPEVNWDYDAFSNLREKDRELIDVVKKPREWV